jgi:hypothetical protein
MPDITTVWKVVWEKLLSNQLLKSVYCISKNETPNKDIIFVNIDNMLCDTAQLMRAKVRNVKCPNHRGICTANLDRKDVIGNESFS